MKARWSTSSHARSADTSPAELALLGDHLTKGLRGRLFAFRMAFDALDRYVTSRLVTTLAVSVFMAIVACAVF